VLEGSRSCRRPGDTTAIIGSTGSGKTTLLNLIPRLADATSGAVLVDGVDVRDLQPEALWSRVGVVPQKPYLFSGTVASNLRYGKSDASEGELWEALEVAQAADFVTAMGGLEAVIAQGGSNVSGAAAAAGDRSRARAQARDLPVRRLVLRSRPRDRRTTARRARAVHVERDGRDRRAAGVDDLEADQILVLEDGRTVGLGHAPRAARDVPDVRRDRRRRS
jgi:ATP-binding cassette subfamily B protein